ncbi:glycosyltransferase involved in cell wall biosynthesis [Leucobacter komagatae]|uniref:D-inositol 3-phosphate glycosyltransferase n=1 Tax=Leucobacter komagatae TaxID=55969 RepID=A0A542Y8G4_9MICO|nr:glycosyltransferase [Leucobacter komagatae]TQL44327.1 glycosyltransferase involved in cell wall biosynthesis [Leucobacter komagatae]
MHILIVTDQHPDSLGGVQVALRLQRRFLERAGHTVSIAAPALHRRGYEQAEQDRGSHINLPSMPITQDREYGLTWPGRRSDRALDRALAAREAAGEPPVDLVHIQGDFWGAMIGLRAAKRHALPVVFTMHNNVDEGTRAVTPLAPLAFAGLRAWRLVSVGRVPRAERERVSASDTGAWRYLAELTAGAALVTAPSGHFAAELERHGVSPLVGVTQGGVDDELIAEVRAVPRASRERPKLVWLGRMSGEKRVLEFVEALGRSGVNADVALHGAGLLLARVERRIEALGLGDRVRVAGPVPYEKALAAMRDADALVQTSIGFETQGLTPYEAAALGTPTVFCDANIAEDLAVTPSWLAPDASVDALAETLRVAVGELAERAGQLRVSPSEGERLLQSTKTAGMIALYERVLGR